MNKKALLAISLMVLGTCLVVVVLPLQLWDAPEAPASDPPVAPDFSNITDPEHYQMQMQAYNDAMKSYNDEQEQYEEDLTDWAYASLFSSWFPWLGLCCLLWGMFVHVGVQSVKTPLEEYNEVQCRHCGKWIKRSWRICPFCSKDQ